VVFRKYLRRVALSLPPLQHLHTRLVQLRQANADLAAVIATTTDERDRLLQELAATTAGRERLLAAATADRGRLLYELAMAAEDRCNIIRSFGSTPDKLAASKAHCRVDEPNRPLISVIVPVLNELHIAARAIKSVMGQSYDNWEMIVVLDAAAKGDELDFAERDARVRIIRDLGKGSGAARNLGIDLSLGHYIAFLDHDDWFEPNKLERQISAMLEAHSLFSHTSYFAVYPTRREGRAVIGSGKFSGRVFPHIMQHCPVAMPTVMIHRSIPERGFRFGAGHLGADSLLWVGIAKEYELLGIPEPLTTVEWSDQSAVIDLSKSLIGLTTLRDVFLEDPFYRSFTAELDALSEYMKYVTSFGDATINHELINSAFAGDLE
jgi:glycosyltransferase involved in cell wall biosynthesis